MKLDHQSQCVCCPKAFCVHLCFMQFRTRQSGAVEINTPHDCCWKESYCLLISTLSHTHRHKHTLCSIKEKTGKGVVHRVINGILWNVLNWVINYESNKKVSTVEFKYVYMSNSLGADISIQAERQTWQHKVFFFLLVKNA